MVNGLGERLRKVRTAKGITLQTLSDITGISKTQLYLYEKCEQDIKAQNLSKLCTALNVSADFLIFGKKLHGYA